jgi:hypothetical protein
MSTLVDIAATATCSSSASWAFCWMIVSRRRFKSLDNAADIVKCASAEERAKVAKAMAELARAFDRERPPHVSGLYRRGRDAG